VPYAAYSPNFLFRTLLCYGGRKWCGRTAAINLCQHMHDFFPIRFGVVRRDCHGTDVVYWVELWLKIPCRFLICGMLELRAVTFKGFLNLCRTVFNIEEPRFEITGGMAPIVDPGVGGWSQVFWGYIYGCRNGIFALNGSFSGEEIVWLGCPKKYDDCASGSSMNMRGPMLLRVTSVRS